MTISRRGFLTGAAGLIGAGAFALYGGGIEPAFRLVVTRYALTPPGWPRDFALNIAVIADPHVAEPYMGAARVEEVVEATNRLQPDLVVLLGDFEASHRFVTREVPANDWARRWAQCRAPLGVRAILGNHDWWFHLQRIRRAL